MCSMVRNLSTASALSRRARSSAAIRPRLKQAFQSASPDCPPGTIIRFSRQVIEANSWLI